jgi:hypothetical protein
MSHLQANDPIDPDRIVEQVDQRGLWRRAEDGRRNLMVIGLSALLVAMGVAWGTATATVAQKVDRSEFNAHIAQSERRFYADSMTRTGLVELLRRIEVKQDSTNNRLTRLICDKQPLYCR